MTVRELIEGLQKLKNQDFEVLVEFEGVGYNADLKTHAVFVDAGNITQSYDIKDENKVANCYLIEADV